MILTEVKLLFDTLFDKGMENELVSKLILGTVQFGCEYGINSAGRPSNDQVKGILRKCLVHGIDRLDTSSAYGESERILGKTMENKEAFKIISKYPKCTSSVHERFETTLRDLRVEAIYGYLLHHFQIYAENPMIWKEFMGLKESGRVRDIGFSLYTTEELDRVLGDAVHFDIVQIPYSIFDRKFEPYFKELYDRGVKIHVRSTFLQGLFFKDRDMMPERLRPMRKYLLELDKYALENGLTVAEVALNSNLQNPYIDGVLIGVDNREQLLENIRSVRNIPVDFKPDIKEQELLNPVNWK